MKNERSINPRFKYVLEKDYVRVIFPDGNEVLVDSMKDVELANQGWGWGVFTNSIRVQFSSLKKVVPLHRLIMEPPADKQVDHINMNFRDNRRSNLRICTLEQNKFNRKVLKSWQGQERIHNHGFKGIVKITTESNQKKPWLARLGAHNKKYNGPMRATPEEAAKDYDKLAVKYHGEFARLNFPITTKEQK